MTHSVYLVYFQAQMLVHLCLSVLLTIISLIVFISTVTYELINDDDDDGDILHINFYDDVKTFAAKKPRRAFLNKWQLIVLYRVGLFLIVSAAPQRLMIYIVVVIAKPARAVALLHGDHDSSHASTDPPGGFHCPSGPGRSISLVVGRDDVSTGRWVVDQDTTTR